MGENTENRVFGVGLYYEITDLQEIKKFRLNWGILKAR